MKNINIFNYTDYRKYLKDYYNLRKKQTKDFSLRAFSKQAGLSANNIYYLIMSGKRSLTKNILPNFLKVLNLSLEEESYLKLLIEYDKVKLPLAKRQLKQKMSSLKKKSQRKEFGQYKYDLLRNWYNLTIRELLLLTDFKNDPNWIAKKLKSKITPFQVNNALRLLKRSGLIKESHGKLKTTSLEIEPFEPNSKILKKYKQTHDLKMLEYAKEALTKESRDNRQFACIVEPVSKETFDLLKTYITKKVIPDIGNFIAFNNKKNEKIAIAYIALNMFKLTD